MELIDKDAIVAEIEKRKRKNVLTNESAFEEDIDILSFISTLEVKEIDLEKEMSEYFVEHSDEFFSDKYKLFAQHFFELGLSVNNSITASDRGMAEEIIINLKRVEKDYRIDLTKEMEWLRNKVKKGEDI